MTRMRRIDYKTKDMKGLMIRGSKVKPRVVTKEEKELRFEIGRLENKLNRILGKKVVGRFTDLDQKRVESLRKKILVLMDRTSRKVGE